MVEVPFYLLLKQKAAQQYDVAFHLLTVTFPLAKDPKILIGLAQNIATAQESAMEALLGYERTLKLIPAYGSSFASKLSIFQQRTAKRHNFSPELTNSLVKLREVIEMHLRSPQEFPRGSRFIIADRSFRHLEPLSVADLKQHLQQTKTLLEHAERIIRS